jgi:hypothetical protein
MPSRAALPFLGLMHHADCAHVAAGTEPHDGKARNRRFDGGIDNAAPAHRPDFQATGNDDRDFPHVGVDDHLDVPIIELGLAQINRHRAHACVDLGEAAHLPAALKADLAHRARNLERFLTPSRGRSELDRERQAAHHRGHVSLGPGPEQRIEGFMKAVELHLAAGQEFLQEVDPALLDVRRDRGSGLGWEPVVVHARRLSAGLAAIAFAAESEDRCLDAVVQAEFGENAADVSLDGLLADDEVPGDLPVAVAAGDQPEYFAFAR